MKLGWITLYVSNLEQSLEFYQKVLNLKIAKRFQVGPQREIVFLETTPQNTQIELICDKENSNPQHNKDSVLGFVVPSLTETIKHLKNLGITNIEGPIKPDPSIEFIFIQDPDKVQIQFAQNL